MMNDTIGFEPVSPRYLLYCKNRQVGYCFCNFLGTTQVVNISINILLGADRLSKNWIITISYA